MRLDCIYSEAQVTSSCLDVSYEHAPRMLRPVSEENVASFLFHSSAGEKLQIQITFGVFGLETPFKSQGREENELFPQGPTRLKILGKIL